MTQLRSDGTPNFELLTLVTKNGDNVNLLPLLVELEIFEDIFSPVLTGVLTIDDNVGLFDNLPLTSKEQLIFKASSWNYSIQNDDVNFLHRKFDILRITDVTQINDYTKRISLHFASPEMIKNETLQISKGYTNKTISDIVEDLITSPYDVGEENIASSGLGFEGNEEQQNPYSPFLFSDQYTSLIDKSDEQVVSLFVEKTKHNEPTISFPYMKPFDIINWLASRSFRASSGRENNSMVSDAANFVFFENKRGINFISIESLLENKEISNTKFEYGSGKQNNFKTSRNVSTETIRELQIQDCHDVLKNIRNGVYASKMNSYDLSNGQINTIDYDYIENFYNTESTERTNAENDYPMIPSNDEDLSQRFLGKRLFVINTPNRVTDTITSEQSERSNSSVTFAGAENYLQKRLSQLGRLSNFRLIFEIGGNSKHKVGDMVEIDLKTPIYKNNNQIEFTQESNKYYSGFYLLTSIRHHYTKKEYKMDIEAVKDAHRTEIKRT